MSTNFFLTLLLAKKAKNDTSKDVKKRGFVKSYQNWHLAKHGLLTDVIATISFDQKERKRRNH